VCHETNILNLVLNTEQDRGLEALSEVISRQKNLAQVIGNEVDYQNELIDDITDHVDRTRDRIHGETQRVRTIDRKDATCRTSNFNFAVE
jgi:syntaxin 8